MPGRLLAGATVVRAVIYCAVVVYFGYMLHRISAQLNRIANTLEELRIDKASQS